jgi:hypothetical protein
VFDLGFGFLTAHLAEVIHNNQADLPDRCFHHGFWIKRAAQTPSALSSFPAYLLCVRFSLFFGG